MRTSGIRDYPLARALRARLMGLVLAAAGVLVLVVTLVLATADLPAVVGWVVVVLLVLALCAPALALGRSWYVVRLDDLGYRVRFVRGVGRSQARWTDVSDVTTEFVSGTPCVVLRLRDGGRSTVPVDLIEGDREAFVDELRRRLDSGHGYRRV